MAARITIVCDGCGADGATSLFDGSAPRGEIDRLRAEGPVRRVHVARSPCRDLCSECAAKHRIEAAEARAARQVKGGVG